MSLDTIYELLIETRDEVREMRPLADQGVDHEARIRTLESRTGGWAAVLAFLAVAVPIMIALLL